MKNKPLIVVPTTCSKRYIYQSIKAYKKELVLLKKAYPFADMLVVVNGDKESNKSVFRAVVAADVGRIIQIEQAGKNNAINQAVLYAKNHGFDAVHLLDDDVELTQGSVLRNIAMLYERQRRLDSKILVSGSHFTPFPNRRVQGLRKRYFRSLFSLPYNVLANKIPAISGQSICFFTRAVPTIPSNVADDSFLCQWAVSGRLKEQAIVKHPESVVFFEPAHSLMAWYRQKLRTATGILAAEEKFHLEHYFSHRFSCLREHRSSLKGVPFRYVPNAIVLRLLLTLIEIRARKRLKNKKEVSWATVEESKPHKYRLGDSCE